MKKLILSASLLLMLFSCQKNDDDTSEANLSSETNLSSVNLQRSCASNEVLQRQLQEDPGMAARMSSIESFIESAPESAKLVNGKIVIPVVVNVIYRTAAENISEAQIRSQISTLNSDFNARNTNYAIVPALFSGVKANVGISFELSTINRKSTTRSSWGTEDEMKRTNQGGLNPTTPTTKLNIWVCTIGDGVLGYAQFPGGSSATDGIVVDSRYFGTTGTATYPFNLGRTTTHEVGHWLNLRHIWGDRTCGSDLVADTPTHNGPNSGAPAYPHYSTCPGKPVEMTMNYMDYTDDRGMSMFTKGQKARINAVFASGGPRNAFAR